MFHSIKFFFLGVKQTKPSIPADRVFHNTSPVVRRTNLHTKECELSPSPTSTHWIYVELRTMRFGFVMDAPDSQRCFMILITLLALSGVVKSQGRNSIIICKQSGPNFSLLSSMWFAVRLDVRDYPLFKDCFGVERPIVHLTVVIHSSLT